MQSITDALSAAGRFAHSALRPEKLLYVLNQPGQLRVFRVHLVDDYQLGLAGLCRRLEHLAGYGFDAGCRVNDYHGRLRADNRLYRRPYEIRKPRRIDYVYLLAPVLGVNHRRLYRMAVCLLLIVIIADTGLVIYAA